MTLEDWDKRISPHLQFIEAGGAMVQRHVDRLVARPWFETMAQAELERAKQSLEMALAKINAAQEAYLKKPVDA